MNPMKMSKEQFAKTVFQNIPDKITDLIEKEAGYAQIEEYELYTLYISIFTIIGAVTAGFLAPFHDYVRIGIAVIGATALPVPMSYLYISLKAERRKKKMEDVLPDALRLTSANVKSGNTIEKAFLLSARDEFGPLAEEFRTAAMEVYAGEPVPSALQNMEKRVKSPMFSETIKLLSDAIEAGANTADLLESSAQDVRKSIELREEIKSSIRMYVVFIMMAAVVGAPLLFSISVHMAEETTEMWEDSGIDEMDDDQMAQAGGEIGFDMEFEAPDIDIDFFNQFAMMAIVITNIFAALIISQIQNGTVKHGAKYVPIFVTVSLTLFILVRRGVAAAMGGMA